MVLHVGDWPIVQLHIVLLHIIKEMYQTISEFNPTSKLLTCSLMMRIYRDSVFHVCHVYFVLIGMFVMYFNSVYVVWVYRLKHHRGRLRWCFKNKGVSVYDECLQTYLLCIKKLGIKCMPFLSSHFDFLYSQLTEQRGPHGWHSTQVSIKICPHRLLEEIWSYYALFE